MAFLVKALFQWNKSLKNADISVLRNFLAIFFDFFSRYREILLSTIYLPNFRSIGPFKQQLRREGEAEFPPPGHTNLQKPGLFRVKGLNGFINCTALDQTLGV